MISILFYAIVLLAIITLVCFFVKKILPIMYIRKIEEFYQKNNNDFANADILGIVQILNFVKENKVYNKNGYVPHISKIKSGSVKWFFIHEDFLNKILKTNTSGNFAINELGNVIYIKN